MCREEFPLPAEEEEDGRQALHPVWFCATTRQSERAGKEASHELLPVSNPGGVPAHRRFLSTAGRSGHVSLPTDLQLSPYFLHLPQQQLDHPSLVANCKPGDQKGRVGARGQRHKAGPQEQHQKPLSFWFSIRKTPAATGHLPKTGWAFAKRPFSQTGISCTIFP